MGGRDDPLLRCGLAGLVQRGLHPGVEVLQRLLGLVECEVAPADQRLDVALADAAEPVDLPVHERLGVARIVALVVAVAAVAHHVDHHVLVEPLPIGEGQSGDPDAGLGVVAVDVDDRGLHRLGDVGGVLGAACGLRRGGEAELVVHDHVDGPADAVALDQAEVQRLGHDALSGERGVSVHEDRQHREPPGPVVGDLVHAGPGHALDHRVDRLEVRRVGGQADRQLGPAAADERALLAQVVLDVAGALDRVGVHVALELAEQLVERLADDVGQHVEAAAVRHAQVGGVHAVVGGFLEQGVEDRDQRLGTFETEALLAEVLGGQELLEGLGRVEPSQDVALVLDVDPGAATLHLLLDPALLRRLLDVAELDADRAAVRVAQHVEQVPEPLTGHPADRRVDAVLAAGQELAVEVPDGQPVGGGIELGVHLGGLGRERVEVRDQVTAHAVHVDQGGHLHLLDHLGGLASFVAHRVLAPAHRLVGHAHRAEQVVVEAVLAQEQLLDLLEEQPGLGALDDPVVVGRAEGEHLGHAELGEGARVGTGVRRGEAQRSGADDRPLTGHEARDRPLGADRAGVGEGDRGALEVVDGELVGLGLADELVVDGAEAGEVHRVGVLDDGDHEGAGAVGLLHVDGESQPHVLPANQAGRPVGAFDEVVVHHRDVIRDRAYQGVADDVGEADLAAPGPAQVAVDDAAVDLEELGRDLAERRGGRDLEAGLHVGHDAGADAADGVAGLVDRPGGRRCGRRCGRWCGRCGWRGPDRSGGRGRGRGRRNGGRTSRRAVVGEEVPPRLADRARVRLVLLEHLLDQPGVGAERLGGDRIGRPRRGGSGRFGGVVHAPQPIGAPRTLLGDGRRLPDVARVGLGGPDHGGGRVDCRRC